jgi:uncharacterized protein (TIGR01777 family)
MADKKCVLIAGGSGMIGSRLTELFLEKGYKVRVLSRNGKPIPGCRVFKWNPETGVADAAALKDVEILINLAGSGIADRAWTTSRKLDLLNSRVYAARTLYDMLSNTKHEVKTFINASAIGFYPESDEWMHEEDKAADNFLGALCQKWEKEAMRITDKNIRTCIIRIGLVLSPKGGMLKELLLPFNFFVAPVFGNGEQMQSWIHIDDLCRIFISAAENTSLQGVFNAAAPNPVTNANMIRAIQSIRKQISFKIHVPVFLLRMMLGERASILLASQKISAEKITAHGFEFSFNEIISAMKNLMNK